MFLEGEKATEGETVDTSQDKLVHGGSHTWLHMRTPWGSFKEMLMPSRIESESLVGAKSGGLNLLEVGSKRCDRGGTVFSLPMLHSRSWYRQQMALHGGGRGRGGGR